MHFKMRKNYSKIREVLLNYEKNNKRKLPNLLTLQYEDELKQLKWKHGVRRFPPSKKIIKKSKTSITNCEKTTPFLWVALKDKIKIITEKTNSTWILTLKKAKHTNITGGGKAHAGGELWFIDNDSIVVTFSSGRYGPSSESELIRMSSFMQKCLQSIKYSAKILGWDSGIGRPTKYPR